MSVAKGLITSPQETTMTTETDAKATLRQRAMHELTEFAILPLTSISLSGR